jgi:DNA-directed RNA polymerase III subunit RPC6
MYKECVHFYSDGKLDMVFIDALKNVCLKCIFMQKVSTCDGCLEWIKKSGIFNTEVTRKQIEEILQTLVLDDEIMQMTSTGYGDFASIPVGKTCYITYAKARVDLKGKRNLATLLPFHVFLVSE